ncbi:MULTISPECIES: phage tail protein [Pseudomonas]|uniref:Phage tail protein n=1 Tax=Pseudomonas monteilii TaxID=76759 RepID=A0AAP7FN25_9PSED|nr:MULTISPECIES: phage tail protein [Pseudomonas]AYO02567.1 phage tail protein [Pseudomonas sp. LTGT-11-2Z]MCE0874107.1 phage tail protein [Pseudomonas monteilii]MCE0927900.1 phage tail protein [Pseudomonas monteilii]MCT8188312.1 phage tail protein [Pseudomonas monteilii]OAH52428.1 phage tail protein [Pseudomonas monteilii]
MIKLKLPFWLEGTELTKLKNAAQSWWEKVEQWLKWPLLQIDAETCHLTVLDLLAWQRDIQRFQGEPEALYRLRVKYAFINAVEAGSTAGMIRIFQRLGIGYVEIQERLPDQDWDIVSLLLSDSQLSENPVLLRVLIQQYGRTCRRYEFSTITPVSMAVCLAEFNDDQVTLSAVLDTSASRLVVINELATVAN